MVADTNQLSDGLYRPPRAVRILYWGFAGCWALLALATAGSGGWGGVAVGLMVAVLAVWFVLMALSSVTLTAHGLEICNWPTRHHLRWHDITGISMTGMPGRRVVTLVDGGRIGVAALNFRPSTSGQRSWYFALVEAIGSRCQG